MRLKTCLFIFIVSISGIVSASGWHSPYYVEHPLVGKIFAVAEKDWVAERDVVSAMRDVQYLLIGETHSNIDHHIGQARLIEKWHKSGPEIGLVFEMIETEKWPVAGQAWTDATVLTKHLKNVAPRWKWDLYQPIIATAVEYNLPLFGANLSRNKLASLAKNNTCRIKLAHKEIEFCETIEARDYQRIRDLVFDAHCGYLPKSQVDTLVDMQIARDASFALSLLQVIESRAALITGAVHARKDIGVPQHLDKFGEASLSVAFLNVDPERLEPTQYVDTNVDDQYDFIYFTPSDRNIDPCVEFAEQLKRLNHTKKNK